MTQLCNTCFQRKRAQSPSPAQPHPRLPSQGACALGPDTKASCPRACQQQCSHCGTHFHLKSECLRKCYTSSYPPIALCLGSSGSEPALPAVTKSFIEVRTIKYYVKGMAMTHAFYLALCRHSTDGELLAGATSPIACAARGQITARCANNTPLELHCLMTPGHDLLQGKL